MTNEKIYSILELKSWLLEIGCTINPKVDYPGIFDNNLTGMIAKEQINPGEILVLVKWDATFSTELLQTTLLSRIFINHPELFGSDCPEGLDNKFLALVLYEKIKGPSSKWNLFFKVLPDFPENLCDWDEISLQALQDPDLVYDSKIRKQKNTKCYEQLKSILSSYPEFFPEEISLNLIEWCWKIIWTRSFMRSPDHSALVPFADFINHGHSTTGFYFVDQKAEQEDETEDADDTDDMFTEEKYITITCKDLYEINFCGYEDIDENSFEVAKQIFREANALDDLYCKTGKPKKEYEDVRGSDFVIVTGEKEEYSQGSQIFIEYGNYSNASLLIHYGFAMENNRHDIFRLGVELQDLITKPQFRHLPQK